METMQGCEELLCNALGLLGSVKRLKYFHRDLCAQEFHLRSDLSSLTYLLGIKNLKEQTAC
jgi:hypothetical protein